ncbi:MAG TPA: pitrilysin family protein [Gemmatimonadales bacterium]|nr:pitrilysin family protein [Gemmatimonadales bacterium]
MIARTLVVLAIGIGGWGLGAGELHAQVTTPPTLAPPPGLKMPAVQEARLPNGLRLVVVPMHEVPLVQVVLSVAGGGRDDGPLAGLATFTAGMLDKGAGSRDANTIAEDVAYLGATLFAGADWNGINIALRVPKRSMGPALDLMADVALRPAFSAAEVKRQRDLRLANLVQQRDNPGAVASLHYSALVFPKNHPYHQPLGGDSASTSPLDSATVRTFYQRSFRPDRATMVVTGDITLPEAREEIGRRFGSWPSGSVAPKGSSPAVQPSSRPTTIFLVDKPAAAQSVIRMGHRGALRSSPDYYALQVMNTLLGGSFSSRLNSNLRETKGYTYGARSSFDFQPLPGPFTALADVRTDVTDSSLVEFMKELRRIRDSAVDPVELERTKQYLALRVPGSFETTGQVAGQVGTLLTFGLPFTWFDDYVRRIMAVTAEEVRRVARQYVHPDSLTIVVVGDVQKIRPGIERLGFGPIEVRKP